MLKGADVYSLLCGLNRAEAENEHTLYHIHGQMYLAKSYTAQHCIVVRFPKDVKLQSGRATKGLELSFYDSSQYELNGELTRDKWAVVTCLDAQLELIFGSVAEGLLDLGATRNVSPHEIVSYIEDWQELFSVQNGLSPKQALGLWGELFFILSSTNIENAVSVWYGPLKKKFDFSGNGVQIDVKTSLKGHVHRFSYEQLLPSPSEASRYICSLYVEEDTANGITLASMIEMVHERLPKLSEFDRKLLSSGYNSASEFQGTPYSVRNKKLVHTKQVPRIAKVDPGITNVRYDSDLSFCADEEDHENILSKLFS